MPLYCQDNGRVGCRGGYARVCCRMQGLRCSHQCLQSKLGKPQYLRGDFAQLSADSGNSPAIRRKALVVCRRCRYAGTGKRTGTFRQGGNDLIVDENGISHISVEEFGTRIMSWGPFAEGRNSFFSNPILAEIGHKYGKSVAQVAMAMAHSVRCHHHPKIYPRRADATELRYFRLFALGRGYGSYRNARHGQKSFL